MLFMMKFRVLTLVVLVSFMLAAPLHAQRGDSRDSAGMKQADPIPADKIPPQPVLSPEEAMKTFKIQPGFRMELVAAEPLVQCPVAMAFGPDGRIWVAEMNGYMPNPDGIGEGKPIGDIVVLESSHHDGHLDKRVVFADHLVLPRALALVRDGVLIGEPPHLWFYPIIDGNKAGQRVEVRNDFGSTYNPQGTANGLMWSLDNWIYSASYSTRIRSTDDGWQFGPTTHRGEYGITQDEFGRIIYNSNEDQFRIDLVSAEYIARNPNYRHEVGLNVDPIHDQTVWPSHMTPGVNRGYWKDILRPDGTLAKTTAACSPLIYRGDNFPPEYTGNAFVCEPAGNLVIRDILVETNGAMTGHEANAHEDFLTSTDERFRPVNLYNGPDGTMYLVDFHRGILEHRLSLTTYLRRQIESRKLQTPQNLGRLYRIVYGDGNPVRATLADLNSPQLVEKLGSPNGWVQDTAQRLLVERSSADAIQRLKAQICNAPNPVTQIHSAWTLDGMGQMDKDTLFSLLGSSNPKVRATGIRLSEGFLHGPKAGQFLNHLALMARDDLDPDVQLQLAFTFGQSMWSMAQVGLGFVAEHSSSNPFVREAIMSSLYQHESEFIEKLAHGWKGKEPGRAELLEGLAECVINSRSTNGIAQLLDLAVAAPDWQQKAILDGLGARARGNVKKIYFTAEPRGLAQLRGTQSLAARVDKVSHILTWPEQAGYVPPPYVPPLSADEQKQYNLGHDLFSVTCAACHQPTGLGARGVAPPLVDSEWVLGSNERLIRIVLKGLQGPIKAAGVSFDSTMPSWASFNDEQLAGILTYIRRDWEQGAPPIKPAMVKAIREATVKHDGAWTSEELTRMP